MRGNFSDIVARNPVIATVKNDEGLRRSLNSKSQIVFALYGSVLSIEDIVAKLKEQDKIVFVDVDLIDGFSSKDIVIEYLRTHTKTDGILSSKVNMIKAANKHGFITIHRLFVIDSLSFHNIEKQVKASKPDYIQILPGFPKAIKWVREIITTPIIAGGLVCEKEDVIAVLGAGAIAASSTNDALWSLGYSEKLIKKTTKIEFLQN